jgi:hypothetical protein
MIPVVNKSLQRANGWSELVIGATIQVHRVKGVFAALCVFSGLASAQDLSLSKPGSLNFAKPSGDNGDAIFKALPFMSSSYTRVGYDDDIFTSHTDRVGSVYSEFGLTANVNVGNERTQLTGTGTAAFIAYWQRPGSKVDPNLNFDLRFRHQFSERTVVTLDSILSYQAQPDSATRITCMSVSAILKLTRSCWGRILHRARA